MKRRTGKRAVALLCALVLSIGLMTSAAAADSNQETRFETLYDFSGVVMGTLTGTIHDQIVSGLVDGVQFQYYDDFSSLLPALQNGMIDAATTDLPLAQLAAARQPDLVIFPESLAPDSYGLGLQKDSPLTPQVDAIIESLQADGTLDAMAEKWMGADESVKVIDVGEYDAPNGPLHFVHDATLEPMSYVGS